MGRQKAYIQCIAFVAQHVFNDLHSGITQHAYAASAYLREWVGASNHHTGYAGVNDKF